MPNGRYAKWSSCQMSPGHSTRYAKWPDEITEGISVVASVNNCSLPVRFRVFAFAPHRDFFDLKTAADHDLSIVPCRAGPEAQIFVLKLVFVRCSLVRA